MGVVVRNEGNSPQVALSSSAEVVWGVMVFVTVGRLGNLDVSHVFELGVVKDIQHDLAF